MISLVDIARDEHAPSRARRAVRELGELGPELAERATLLVSELVTNSVRHGAGDRVRLVLDSEPGRLHCEVIDDGGGFTPEARSRPATEPGGWGLALVEVMADGWGVRDGSTHVWFELREVPGAPGPTGS
jgi:two-component sensor histidine kinase